MSYNITGKNYSIGINSTYALLYISVKKNNFNIKDYPQVFIFNFNIT